MNPTSRRRFVRLTAAAGALAAAGCSGPRTTYYRIVPVAGMIYRTGTATLKLREISVPGYLNGNGVPEPSGAYQFAASPNDLWAEPLAGMLQSVLIQNLGQRLPEMTVTGSQGSIGAPADMTLEINLLRFDPDAGGRITLQTQMALKQADGTFLFTRNFQASAIAGAEIPAMMAAMSTLWAEFSDTLAQAIAHDAPPVFTTP